MANDYSFSGIVTAGSWCVDINKSVSDWPTEELSEELLQVTKSGGGSACNFAIDMKLLDPNLKVATTGLLGDDENGHFLKNIAIEYGIDNDRLQLSSDQVTPYTEVYTSLKTGRRTHIYFTRSKDQLAPHHLTFSGMAGWFLHLGQPSVHPLLDQKNGEDSTGWVTVLKNAQENGLTTNIELASSGDPMEIARLNRPSLPFLDMLIINDFEIQALAGLTPEISDVVPEKRLFEAAKSVLEAGSMKFVVVHYPRGALCVTRDGSKYNKPSFAIPSDQFVGANGAGDAFAAGFVCGLTRQVPLDDCLVFGHATAMASVRDITAYRARYDRRKPCL